jgi:hypothetical protein
MLPMSYFEKDKTGGGRPSVNITINGIGGNESQIVDEAFDDVEDVSDKGEM